MSRLRRALKAVAKQTKQDGLVYEHFKDNALYIANSETMQDVIVVPEKEFRFELDKEPQRSTLHRKSEQKKDQDYGTFVVNHQNGNEKFTNVTDMAKYIAESIDRQEKVAEIEDLITSTLTRVVH
jgi:hypothetical protein